MSTNTEQAIIEKVRAILDRANHPNTPAHEADTAFTLAQKLIIKYNHDESALADARQEVEDIVTDHIDIFGKYALRRLEVCAVVAVANSCAVYRTTVRASQWSEDGRGNFVRAKEGYQLHLYGTEKDIFATKVLWSAVEILGLRTIPKGDRGFRNSWWHGFKSGINKSLNNATKQFIQESGSTGVALVLRDRTQRAREELKANVKLRSSPSSSYSRSDAFIDGHSSGNSFSTGGVGRGAIGALGA